MLHVIMSFQYNNLKQHYNYKYYILERYYIYHTVMVGKSI